MQSLCQVYIILKLLHKYYVVRLNTSIFCSKKSITFSGVKTLIAATYTYFNKILPQQRLIVALLNK